MSKLVTPLASGQLNTAGAAITVELITPTDNPPMVRVTWPDQSTVCTPDKFPHGGRCRHDDPGPRHHRAQPSQGEEVAAMTNLTALGDWESVHLKDRRTYIVYDSDVMQKSQVQNAPRRLDEFLRARGADLLGPDFSTNSRGDSSAAARELANAASSAWSMG